MAQVCQEDLDVKLVIYLSLAFVVVVLVWIVTFFLKNEFAHLHIRHLYHIFFTHFGESWTIIAKLLYNDLDFRTGRAGLDVAYRNGA